MQHKMIAKVIGNFFVGIERGPEKTAVRAAQFFVEITQQSERENRFSRALRFGFRLIKVRPPEQPGRVAIPLSTHGVERRPQPEPSRICVTMIREQSFVRFQQRVKSCFAKSPLSA